jgi:3,5-epimerase/4-reductase
MRYLIFGKGYFGQKLAASLPDAHIAAEVDITNPDLIRAALDTHKPDVLINCAGKTGRPNVDWCEDHKLETLHANVTGPLTILKVAAEMNQYWVHLGSGCVYNGDNGGLGWSEEDTPNFSGSYYSKTKSHVDQLLADFPVLQLRLRMPLDGEPGARNLITKLVGYKQVISLPNSISVVPDVVRAVEHLANLRATGIFNVVNPGAITHREILDMYRDIVDPSHETSYISLEELAHLTKAPRSNCVLSTDKLKSTGLEIGDIHTRVRDMLHEYQKAKS